MPMLDPSMFNQQQGTPGWLLELLANQGVGQPGAGSFPQDPMQAQASAPMPAQAPPPQQQGPGMLGMLGNGISQNPMTLMALGAGIMQGGFGKGLEMAVPAAMADQKTRLTSQNQNLTYKALIKKGIDSETALAATVNPTLLQSLLSSGTTDDIKEYNFAKTQGFKGGLLEWMAAKRGGAGEYGMTPIWGIGADGKPAVLQLGKSGTAKQSALPPGFELARDPVKVEGPTGTVILDPQTRQQVGFIPKDVQGAAQQKAIGAVQGQATTMVPQVETIVKNAVKNIQELRNHPGLDVGTGLYSKIHPQSLVPGQPGYDFIAKSKQAQGQAFMAAREGLKGAGQVTDFEGTKGEQAIANLDTAQSKEQYLDALKTLESMMNASLADLKRKAGIQGSSAVPGSNLKSKYGLE